MGRKNNRLAVIFAEKGCGDIQGFKALLAESFARVGLVIYEPLPFRWPLVANQVFQKAAWTMSYFCEPWLFMEPDAVALCPDWIAVMEAEYERGGKPFMGPVVQGMVHANGSMVYPFNAPDLIPESMQATDQAWDMVCGTETVPDLNHDSSRISQHVWCISGIQWLQAGSGVPPQKITLGQAKRNIRKGLAMIHRIKDESLLMLLMSGKFKP